MNEAVFETISYIMRYWFILLIGIMLIGMFYISIREYRNRRTVLAELGRFLGYLEITDGPEDLIGIRIGVTDDNQIGSLSSSDIMIKANGVEKKHAKLYLENDGFILEPLGNGLTTVNGRKIRSKKAVRHGDYFEFGDIELFLYIKEQSDDD